MKLTHWEGSFKLEEQGFVLGAVGGWQACTEGHPLGSDDLEKDFPQ